MSKLNLYQNAVKTVYGGGDFSYAENIGDAYNCGDTLFTFLMVELSNTEGCDSRDDAIQRLETAKTDIECCIEAILHIEDDSSSNFREACRNADIKYL